MRSVLVIVLSILMSKIQTVIPILDSIAFFQWIQALLVCCLVLSNILMLRSFNKALQDSETTLQASVVNTASNFIFTVIAFLLLSQAFCLVAKLPNFK